MFIEKARTRTSGAGRAISLVEAPQRKAILEKNMPYDVHLHGKYWGHLYFNLTGYCGYLPTATGGALDIGERPIIAYRRHIRDLNREWAETGSRDTVPPSPMALASADSRRTEPERNPPTVPTEHPGRTANTAPSLRTP